MAINQRPTPLPRKMTWATGFTVMAGLVVTLLALPAQSNPSLTSAANPAHGKKLFKTYCVACHGSVGQGEFNWMHRDRAAPPLNSTGHAWHHEDAQLVDMILNKPLPDSKMPAWSTVIKRDDALDVVAYIKTLWSPEIRDNCQGAKHMGCLAAQQ